MTRSNIRPSLIVTTDHLESLCAELSGEEYYALDTEFHTERTYFPQLALIQLAWAGHVALVDPLAVDPAPLARLFSGPGIAVAHAADQDLDVLDTACGSRARNGLRHSDRSRLPWPLPPRPCRGWSIRYWESRSRKRTSSRTGYSDPSPIARSPTPPATWPICSNSEPFSPEQLSRELGRLTWALEEVRARCWRSVGARAVPEELWWKMGDIRRELGEPLTWGGPGTGGLAGPTSRHGRSAPAPRPPRTWKPQGRRPSAPKNRKELEEQMRGVDAGGT